MGEQRQFWAPDDDNTHGGASATADSSATTNTNNNDNTTNSNDSDDDTASVDSDDYGELVRRASILRSPAVSRERHAVRVASIKPTKADTDRFTGGAFAEELHCFCRLLHYLVLARPGTYGQTLHELLLEEMRMRLVPLDFEVLIGQQAVPPPRQVPQLPRSPPKQARLSAARSPPLQVRGQHRPPLAPQGSNGGTRQARTATGWDAATAAVMSYRAQVREVQEHVKRRQQVISINSLNALTVQYLSELADIFEDEELDPRDFM